MTKLINLKSASATLAIVAVLSIANTPSASARECLLDGSNTGGASSGVNATACGANASASGVQSTVLGTNASAAGLNGVAIGNATFAAGGDSTAVGRAASAMSNQSSALGYQSSATATGATAVGGFAQANNFGATALGRDARATGDYAVALGDNARATDNFSIAIGGNAARAFGLNSIVIGDSDDGEFNDVIFLGHGAFGTANGQILIGTNAVATDVDQIVLGSADTFTIRGNGNMGLGTASPLTSLHIREPSDEPVIRLELDSFAGAQTWDITSGIGFFSITDETNSTSPFIMDAGAADGSFVMKSNGWIGLGNETPAGNLDIGSGAAHTTLMLTNNTSQWEIKNSVGSGRLTFGAVPGVKPMKFDSGAVNNLLLVGTKAPDQVNITGNLVTTGTVTTGGPTCGGGCDAVFDADYDLPTIEEHAAQMYAKKHLPQVGPTIPLAPVNLSEKMGDMLNELEKAHIYIAQQQAKLKQQDAELAIIKQQIATLINQ